MKNKEIKMSKGEGIAMIILILITATFAVGGIMLGCCFNFLTTGVWFI